MDSLKKHSRLLLVIFDLFIIFGAYLLSAFLLTELKLFINTNKIHQIIATIVFSAVFYEGFLCVFEICSKHTR